MDNVWIFHNNVERIFIDITNSSEFFEKKRFSISEPPSYLLKLQNTIKIQRNTIIC